MQKKFPLYEGKLYSNRRDNFIHLGLDKSLFSFEDYKEYLNFIDKFLTEHLRPEFKVVYSPKLVISTRWKHGYIVRTRL